LPAFLKLTNTDPIAAWLVVTEDATPDGIRSVVGAIGSLPIVAFQKGERHLFDGDGGEDGAVAVQHVPHVQLVALLLFYTTAPPISLERNKSETEVTTGLRVKKQRKITKQNKERERERARASEIECERASERCSTFRMSSLSLSFCFRLGV
jgi:hypothetical protein